MRLTYAGLKEKGFWEKAGIALPSYHVEEAARKAVAQPRWVHFGIGNIFRVFPGGIADDLLEQGALDRGLTCVETFDYEIVDKIYRPCDNLALSVILKKDGTREIRVLGSLAEAVRADYADPAAWKRMKEIFRSADLQLVSFTITEKGYALTGTDGAFLPLARADIENGPEKASSAMGILTSMLWTRYLCGTLPLALVSMDNCSENGSLLQRSVMTMAEAWRARGAVEEEFLAYLRDSRKVSFPWTMIDKITPRPSPEIAGELERLGLEGMQPLTTAKRTYIAPFVNAEKPQYLVIEDSFPNGRPALEKGPGVYMTDRATVRKAERMKVTACLNPVHSAVGPIGVVWGVELFADLLDDPALMKMAKTVAYQEGMPMIEDPGILSPQAFTDELFAERFPNKSLGDTNLRLCTDESQGVGVRFGETVKACVARYGSAERLTAVPLGIAGWLRYLMGVDDSGKPYELAPDPLAEELHGKLAGVAWGEPGSLKDQLRSILSNESIFFTDLYAAGIGEKIEGMLREMISGPGSCRNTVYRYFG